MCGNRRRFGGNATDNVAAAGERETSCVKESVNKIVAALQSSMNGFSFTVSQREEVMVQYVNQRQLQG